MKSSYDSLYKPFYCYLTRHNNRSGANAELSDEIALLVWEAKQELDTRTAYNLPQKIYNDYSERLEALERQIVPGTDYPLTVEMVKQARKFLEKRMLYRVRIKNRVY